jgi:hypothetical protein
MRSPAPRAASATAWSLSRVPAVALRPGPQAKLRIGASNDPAEADADRVADQVMRTAAPSPVQAPAQLSQLRRKCADCEDEAVRRSSVAASAGFAAAPAAETAVDALGSGSSLTAAQRDFFEPRLGTDLSSVRIHTGPKADSASRALGARAFTLGGDIAFARGEYAPNSSEGQRLIAHELAHVLQQSAPGAERRIQGKLEVRDAVNPIPNPTGKGLVQTNAQTAQTYLQTLCAAGAVTVDPASGAVGFGTADFCPKPNPPGVAGPPVPAPSDLSSTPTGCNCLCTMVNSATTYTIAIDDKSWPHTSGTVVTTPSPNSDKLWGTATKSGKATTIDPWLVLGHELCGHAWLGEMGLPDNNANRGEGGHQETVARENLIRQEHAIEERGSFKDPYCGESFSQDKAGPGKIVWSSYLAKCKAWRTKKYGNKYKISDRIP